MTKEELYALLEQEDLVKTIDVKTMVLDIVREMNDEEILLLFWERLPKLEADFIRDYFYMRRS